MTVALRPVLATKTNKQFSWVFGTTVTGVIDAAQLAAASALLRAERKRNPAAVGWLLDASAASQLAEGMLTTLEAQLETLRAAGVQYVAVVLPSFAASKAKLIAWASPGGLVLRAFMTPDEAVRWFDARCPH